MWLECIQLFVYALSKLGLSRRQTKLLIGLENGLGSI